MNRVETRLAEIGLVLPAPRAPVANYVPSVIAGKMLYISGQVSSAEGGGILGVVGDGLTLEDGIAAARLCGINLLAQIRQAVDGDFERVKRIVKLGGFVQAGPDFFDIPKVVNGCSDLMVEVLGDEGRHARSAVGVYRLPLNYAVEVDAVGGAGLTGAAPWGSPAPSASIPRSQTLAVRPGTPATTPPPTAATPSHPTTSCTRWRRAAASANARAGRRPISA